MREMVAGFLLGVVTLVVAVLIPKQKALEMLVLLLVFIAAVYLGFALLDRRRREMGIEVTAIIVFSVLTVLGLWASPHFLVAGYFAHGLWDILHHPRLIQTKIVRWWPPFCLVYDWMVGGFIFWWW